MITAYILHKLACDNGHNTLPYLKTEYKMFEYVKQRVQIHFSVRGKASIQTIQ